MFGLTSESRAPFVPHLSRGRPRHVGNLRGAVRVAWVGRLGAPSNCLRMRGRDETALSTSGSVLSPRRPWRPTTARTGAFVSRQTSCPRREQLPVNQLRFSHVSSPRRLFFGQVLEAIRVDRSDPLPNPQLIEQAAAPLLAAPVVAHSLGDELNVDPIASHAYGAWSNDHFTMVDSQPLSAPTSGRSVGPRRD
jgi:hypothetical protein